MGIKHLNKYLKTNCSEESIKHIELSYLENKIIAIDTSIYLYQFDVEDKLIENMQSFIAILKNHNICPIFIFDGKPPNEKRETLYKRKQQRLDAQEQCNILFTKLQEECNDDEKQQLLIEYNKLKRESITITREKIKSVKELFEKEEVIYYNAPTEADQMCAQMVLNGECWGCMSDDMDMFIYGCNYIIRDIDITNKSATLYDFKKLLGDLGMTYDNFKRVCIISGTDYHMSGKSEQSMNLHTALKLYNRFIKNVKYSNMTFYDWLKCYIKYDTDYKELDRIYKMFSLFGNAHTYSSPIMQQTIC